MQKSPWGGLGAWMIALVTGLVSSGWPELIRPHPRFVVALGIAGLLMLAYPGFKWLYQQQKAVSPSPEPWKYAERDSFGNVIIHASEITAGHDASVSLGAKMQTARDVSGKMFQAEKIDYHEAPQVEQTLLDLDLEIKEVAFNATKTGGLSVFVWVKSFLKRPKQLNATYSLALVMHGISSHFELADDLQEWMFRKRESIGDGGYRPPPSMPKSLEAGVFTEGWLHFVSPTTHPPGIVDCTVRLRADTSAGKLETERHGITFRGTGYEMRRRSYQ